MRRRYFLLTVAIACVCTCSGGAEERVSPRAARSPELLNTWKRKPIDKQRQAQRRNLALFYEGIFGGDLEEVERRADQQVKCKTLSSIYYALLQVHEEYVRKTPAVRAEITEDTKIPEHYAEETHEYVKAVFGAALYYLRRNGLELSQPELSELSFDYSDFSGYTYDLTPELADKIEQEINAQFNEASVLEVCSGENDLAYIQKVFAHADKLIDLHP